MIVSEETITRVFASVSETTEIPTQRPRTLPTQEILKFAHSVLDCDAVGKIVLGEAERHPANASLLAKVLLERLAEDTEGQRKLKDLADSVLADDALASDESEPVHAPQAAPPSALERGTAFEYEVASLLSNPQRRISHETYVGHKRIDLLVEEPRHNTVILMAVECKDYKSAIGNSALAQIWADYQPLVAVGQIHELLVVSRAGFSPAARSLAKSTGNLFLLDYSDLRHQILDLRGYARSLIDSYDNDEDGLSSYFVTPQTSEGIDALSLLNDWIMDEGSLDSRRPVAVLGGYGIGKTSLARHLAARQAKEFLDGSTRAPVYIRLGEIAGEQSLEGLLGAHFTALHPVVGYSFDAFRRANTQGRLVVILDGFDEMKQLLTWEQFKYNIKTLNRLCEGAAKVILLGRPTAFETDDEQEFILQGKVKKKELMYTEPGWPDYQEMTLKSFDAPQITSFLAAYWSYRARVDPLFVPPNEEMKSALSRRQIRDLARRPVQLRMLAEMLPTYSGVIDDLDQGELYDSFIDHMIDRVMMREEDKNSRLAFTRAQRRDFLRWLAFWLWESDLGTTVAEERVPDKLVKPFVGSNEPSAVRRDLIQSCPLDRRPGERLSFPHKSFQEFLVAEEIWLRMRDETITAKEADALISDEVAAFLMTVRGDTEARAAEARMKECEGTLHARSVRAFCPVSDDWATIRSSLSGLDSWRVISWISEVLSKGHSRFDSKWLEEVVWRWSHLNPYLKVLAAAVGPDPNTRLIEDAVGSLLQASELESVTARAVDAGGVHELDNRYVGTMSRPRMQLGIITGRGRIARDQKTKNYRLYDVDRMGVRWFKPSSLLAVEKLNFPRRTNGVFDLDIRGLRSIIARECSRDRFISEWLDEGPNLTRDFELPSRIELYDQEIRTRTLSLLAAIHDYKEKRARILKGNGAFTWTHLDGGGDRGARESAEPRQGQ